MSRRFLPTIDQIKRAAEELPDPMTYEDDECSVSIKTGGSTRELDFKRIKFSSGKGINVYRWIYEGKIMIRNSDKADKSSKSKDDTVLFSLSMR
ncbi:hypothetical protein [Cerasicoccus arenae]|uniref:Uncharacterized protein n=1 Tax=Cerasicoccus arenae TaxID=424488 RepID=A0A8J3DBW8_9BACT|nr:hypothetical protein [Cerasicoccus arenae]MBK1857317.1 hypothetical protein [Cerasicoccus arenae]GHC00658.1 hypothetical protein GCM10007047_16370 [Cerasicoccus arenae]